MATGELAGPDARATWGTLTAGADTGRPLLLQFLPDADNEQREAAGRVAVGYALPQTPLLRYSSAGAPVLSLTLLLSRQPNPDESSIEPLIERATLSFECSLEVPTDALLRLGQQHAVEYRPLYARQAIFTLQDGDAVLAETQGSGSDAHAALTANLNRPQALATLAALRGESVTLTVQCQVLFRTASAARRVRLLGNWAAIHDFIAMRTASAAEISGDSLAQMLDELLAGDTLRIVDDSTQQILRDVPSATISRSFLRVASVILQRQTYELPLDDPANLYLLRGRPHPAMNLDYSESIDSSAARSVLLRTTLDHLLRDALSGRPWDAHVHLVALGDPGTGIGAPPRRVRAPAARRDPRAQAAAPLKLVNLGTSAQSLATVVRPSTTASAFGVVQRPAGTWLLDAAVLTRPSPTVRPMPVVDDANAPLWPDRANPQRYWYAPEFVAVQPAPTDDPQSAAFGFEYQVTGATAEGEPAIKASVRLQLRELPSEATRSALRQRGDPPASAVASTDLAVYLDVPFVDSATGQLRSQRFPAQISRSNGTVTATVELINDWARLCYGALAIANFQQQPARVVVGYTFPALVSMGTGEMQWVWGGKTALTPIVYSADDMRRVSAPVVFDAVNSQLQLPAGQLQLYREAAAARSEAPRLAAGGERFTAMSVASVAARPVSVQSSVAAATLVAAKPSLVKPAVNPGIWNPYVERAVGHTAQSDVLFPCNTLGAFYAERSDAGLQAIGCRDAFKLGSVDYRQYEEIAELRTGDYALYRSLQQPGRYLVVPAYYRITRHPPGSATAYRPCAVLYSLLDNDNPAASQVVFEATLQPDLSEYQRAALRAELRAYAANPILQFPTEVMSDATYTWTLSGTLATPQVVELPDGLQVSVGTTLAQGLLLQNMLGNSGVFGSVEFQLADGSLLRSGLALELRRMTGPWNSGPIEVSAAETGVRLTNRVEQTLSVSEIALYSTSGALLQLLPAEATLAPSASAQTALSIGGAAAVFPVYAQSSAAATTLEESRVFVEDVTTNVIFFVQLNYANHGLQRLDINARLKDEAGTYNVALTGDPPQGTLELVLPLTRYLDKQVLQFQVTKTFTSAAPSETPWIDWDLQANGNVIAITWEMIA